MLRVLSPVEHDGVRYDIGATLMVLPAAAAPLRAVGSAEPAEPVPAA